MADSRKCILWTSNPSILPKRLWGRMEGLGFRVLVSEDKDDLCHMIERTRPSLWVGQANGGKPANFSELRQVRASFPHLPVLITSASPSIEEAMEAVRSGASEYVPEGADEEKLQAILEGLITAPCPYSNENALPPPRRPRDSGWDPIARNSEMKRILALASRIAPTSSTVLIQGESGTGKEVLARFIHARSNRSSGPFVAVNCAALPETLLESELFGHEKGAFTGAVGRKKGKFELADTGTILLDEISEMAPAVQAKLLRVLQEREVDRVGGQSPVRVDVRVLATTNRDLQAHVTEGNFRQDLFYRLNVVPILIPPLRSRPDDIGALARHFLEQTAARNGLPRKGLPPKSEEMLKRMPWPGNVRELENLMERTTLLVDGEDVQPADLEFLVDLRGASPPESAPRDNGEVMTLREVEKSMIFRALDTHQGNRTRASEVLGISVRTLRNKLQEYRKENQAPGPGKQSIS